MSRNGSSTQHSYSLPVLNAWWKIVLAILALSTFESGPVTIHATKAIPTEGKPICNVPDKHLYVLAGPRRSATTSVADFFYQYARGAQPDRKNGKKYHPLAKFRWPMVYGPASNKTETDMPYKRFNHLVMDYANNALRKEIVEAVQRDWEQNGVSSIIFGGEEYEQVGVHARKGYDAIRAVRDVVDTIKAKPECVTVILNYRSPRFEQWVSLYGDGMLVEPQPNTKEEPMPYNEHMCKEESTALRLQELGTSMNPMYIAETYLAEGWNVKMIDMGGVDKDGTDISHTIACDIMGGVCDKDGWVKNHGDEVFNNKKVEFNFQHLNDEETVLSEKLFRYRDCAFQEDLENNVRFDIVQENSIWVDCEHDKDHEWIYQSFRDPKSGTELFYDALLSQVDCKPFGGPKSAVHESHSQILETAEIDEFLDGTYQKNTLLGVIEEVGSFSVPLVLVVIMFAAGVGFYLHKVRENPDYRFPGIEMAGGFADKAFSDKNNEHFRDEDDDDSSSSSSDDEGNDDKFV